MAAGGYQKPNHPAPVSGPGRLARRTDTGQSQKIRELPDAQYGEAATFRDLQQSAPLAQSGGQLPPPQPGAQAPMHPFDGGTQFPDEPVTAGADAGEGPGMDALGLGANPTQEDLQAILPYFPVLQWAAQQPGASKSFRNYVRRIKGAL